MSITAERNAEVIKTNANKAGDTGSPEVQVAILTERITNLTGHFKTHVKDNHSRRGLLKMVSQRRTLLDYVKKQDENRYKTLIERLVIRRRRRTLTSPSWRVWPSAAEGEHDANGAPDFRRTDPKTGRRRGRSLFRMREP